MRDLDPQLLRLREVEARITFAEIMIRDQESIIERLASRGHSAQLAHELLESLHESRGLLVRRREQVLVLMQSTETPLPPGYRST